MTLTEPSVAERAKLEQTRGLVRTERSYAVEGIEVRAPQDGGTVANFEGHASVTGKGYEMYGGPDKGGWMETVQPGAFKRTLNAKPDVPFLINHTGMTLARTKAGTLSLAEDQIGLAVAAALDTRNTEVNNLVVEMERKSIDEMSFAFRVAKQTWTDAAGDEVPWWDLAGVNRSIEEVDIHKGDVSVVNFGANPFTDASLRSLADLRGLALDECDEDELREAIAYLESLLPAPAPVAVHPDLVEAAHRASLRRNELQAELLQAAPLL